MAAVANPEVPPQMVGAPAQDTCTDDAAIAAALQAEEDDLERAEAAAEAERSVGWQGLDHFPGPEGVLPRAATRLSAARGAPPEPPKWSWKSRLAARLLFVAVIGTCLMVLLYFLLWRDREKSPGEYDLGAFHEISRKVFDGTNVYRASKGLPALEWSNGLAEIAADHSAKMASGEARFSHEGFSQRVARFPVMYSSAGENLAQCRGPTNEAVANCTVNGWIASRAHEENLVGRFDLCGVGTARSSSGVFFLTQLFAAEL